MIWRIVSQYAELIGQPPTVSPTVAYAIFDGLFQHGLIKHLCGEAGAADELRTCVEDMLPTLVGSQPAGVAHTD
jgi:hypothetical protein